MQKIIRVYFRHSDSEFCIDRPFNEDMSEQENCDNALNKLLDSMKSGVVVPALKLIKTPNADEGTVQSEHVFINLGNLDHIVILDVRIYEPKPQEPAK